jgi:hypothetical protein
MKVFLLFSLLIKHPKARRTKENTKTPSSVKFCDVWQNGKGFMAQKEV